MTSRRTVELFKCQFCGKEYTSEKEQLQCAIGHDIVYVAISREQVQHLIYTLQAAFLSGIPVDGDIISTLRKYKRIAI